MSAAGLTLSGSAASLRGLLIALPLVALVLLLGALYAKNKKGRRRKPGQYMRYAAPCTAAEVRALFSQSGPEDMFACALEPDRAGAWTLHLTQHLPTGQPMDTWYTLRFENEAPAEFALSFLREAFGMREPVVGEELVDAFMAQKLGAQRLVEEEDGG